MYVSTIGVDLAKNVFQVHGVDIAGKVVITRQLRRKQLLDFFSKLPACLVGMRFWLPAVRRLSLCVSPFPAASSTTALVLATLCSSQAADPLPKRLGEPLSESAAFGADAAAPTPDFQSLRGSAGYH
ncbi:hypothetical protein JQ575_43495 [Bradyrhizobium sp. JYMT SZCCT0428]|nr:hypothetical protein [Bradyrhizobium sp. JYMT SZCCT0428]